MFVEKMMKKNRIYKGQAISFNVDDIKLPNGNLAKREYMDHPGAVAVLAIDNGKIVFVKQYRYPVSELTLEIPAGKLHSKKDDFLKRAKAELKEETGYTARQFIHLIDFWPTPAFSNELLRIYLAKDLKKGRSSPDEDEFLDLVFLTKNEALDMIKNGKIKDSKTIIAILYYTLFFEKEIP